MGGEELLMGMDGTAWSSPAQHLYAALNKGAKLPTGSVIRSCQEEGEGNREGLGASQAGCRCVFRAGEAL